MKYFIYCFLGLIYLGSCQQDGATATGTFEINEKLMFTTVSSSALKGMKGIDADKDYKVFIKKDAQASQSSLYIVEASMCEQAQLETGKDYQLTGIGSLIGAATGSKYIKVESVRSISSPNFTAH